MDSGMQKEPQLWRPEQLRPLPTRILKLEPKDRRVRLVPSAGQLGRYACLSHCWGQHRPVTTTKATLASFIADGIAWADMPATFRDAITLAEKLGIFYIWIDSLCIVQDDLDDWTRESLSMAGIYANGCLTIAAASAASCSEGFRIRSPQPRVSVTADTPLDPARVLARHPVPPHPAPFQELCRGPEQGMATVGSRMGTPRETSLTPSPRHHPRGTHLGV
jgi:hypothetical protein